MITSAENRAWPGDVAIPSHPRTGLPVPSVVRPLKIATIETRHAGRLAQISQPTLKSVLHRIQMIVAEEREA
jgi:mRNA interferase MazF